MGRTEIWYWLTGEVEEMKTFVRCDDKTVFEIDPVITEPLSTECYDAYCFSDPRTDVVYISYSDWMQQSDKRWRKYYEQSN